RLCHLALAAWGNGAPRRTNSRVGSRAATTVHARVSHKPARASGSLCLPYSRTGVREPLRSSTQAQDLLGARSLLGLYRAARARSGHEQEDLSPPQETSRAFRAGTAGVGRGLVPR